MRYLSIYKIGEVHMNSPFSQSWLTTTICRMFVLVVLGCVTVACNSRLTGEIYLGDLDEVTATESLTNLISLHLPVSGSEQEDCVEYQGRYDSVFAKSRDFKNMEYVRCYSEGSDNFAEYELDIPLRLTDPRSGTMEGPVELIRYDASNEDIRYIYIRVNPKSLDNLGDLIQDEFYQSLDLTDTAPEILISNDLRGTQRLLIEHAFVQNAPVVESETFELERRDSISVVLSDVTAAWIFEASSSLPPRYAKIATWLLDDSRKMSG